MAEACAVLLFLPLANYCMVPCFPKVTLRVRIGIGLLLYCMSYGVAMAVEAVGKSGSQTELCLMGMAIIIYAIAEVFTIVSGKYLFAVTI